MAKLQNIETRFWSHVDKRGPIHPRLRTRCWLWDASIGSSGYGQFKIQGSYVSSHRVAWFLTYGKWPIPCALHHCDVRLCVRPLHLFEGTRLDNVLDMKAKGRARSSGVFGELHGSAKLSTSTVLKIRKQYMSGDFTQEELAEFYGITQPHVSDIVHGKARAYE